MNFIVVDDRMDQLAGRYLGLDGVEEADELLMAMALHVAADDVAFEDIEGGEQRRGCRGACSRGSWCRRVPSSWAIPAGCGRGPESGSSRRPRGRRHDQFERVICKRARSKDHAVVVM